MREPHTLESYKQHLEILDGSLSPEGIASVMDGMNVFSFGITTPPKSLKRLCEYYDINIADVDKLVLHQANKFMISKIAKKLKIDTEKVPSCLKDYGNTTNSSIPLTIVTQCNQEYATQKQRTLACGFGTGLAWASVYFETNNIACPDILTYCRNV